MTVDVVDAAVTSELRRAVLRPNWPPGTAMPGDDDSAAVHLAARIGTAEVVGACVLLPRPFPPRPDEPAWQLRGMATAPHAQGRGVGRAVVVAAIAQSQARGARLLWCEARAAAVAFYESQGFVTASEEYPHHETGAPHRLMYRELFVAAESSS